MGVAGITHKEVLEILNINFMKRTRNLIECFTGFTKFRPSRVNLLKFFHIN